MLKVFYYYYYLFYSRVLVQPDPHFVTTLAISASEGFLFNAAVDYLIIKFYCVSIGKWPMLAIMMAFLIFNFILYGKGKGEKIIKMKPLLWGSQHFSFAVTLIFFVISLSWLFWGAVLGRRLLEQCM